MRSALAPLPTPCATVAQAAPNTKLDAGLLLLGESFSAAWAREIEAAKTLDLAAPYNDDDPLVLAYDAMVTATSEIVAKIAAPPATTLAGLIVKARACHWCHGGEPVEDDFFAASNDPSTDDRLGASILRDLVALGSEQAEPAEASTKAIIAAIHATAADDASLLALRGEWLARHAAYYAALDVAEFADRKRFGATDVQKRAAGVLTEAMLDALDDVVDRALALPARTALGIAFKIEMSKEFGCDREHINASILADLASLSGRPDVGHDRASATDPVFAQIDLHKALRLRANAVEGDAGDPAYDAAQDAEEKAIQALGDMLPSTLAGAAAQLAHMADVEGDFGDKQSPLLRTVRTVARALSERVTA